MPVEKISPVNLGEKSEVDKTAAEPPRTPCNEIQEDIVREIIQEVQGLATDAGETLAYQAVRVDVGDAMPGHRPDWCVISNQTRKQVAVEVVFGPLDTPKKNLWFVNRSEMAVFWRGWLCVSVLRNGKAYWIGGLGVEIHDLMQALRNE